MRWFLWDLCMLIADTKSLYSYPTGAEITATITTKEGAFWVQWKSRFIPRVLKKITI
jgi:hypothetical protein